ncbi:hypothetical protein CFN58_30645 [Pseudomonas avellanae]|uniref:Lipoprotein n=2 Tax=Pseudomonas syringae group TaxID=136849 RepID=A0A261WBH4_9PSED|nr:hypothetical protein [Pseudomonas syringae]OZI83546.1 hypothetical protein CFN58_30645 [Pseudomonas avellanae]ATV16741.1 hypothetical protein CT122_07285 [Pseudomonas syringae pv. actinidiae]NYS40726.1 hypothetical protein [Pseudomonas syringae pv. actinidiae]PIN59279.1 hypothetical protein CUB86_22975 [Pseudomonas syringae pv. actinidiae]GAO94353.1 hypothetical protein PSA5_16570 [Pseudomonas syringae pv. actinidiae]
MRMLLAVLLSPVLLAGCAGIPYEKPEDRAAIQNDLAVKPSDIVTVTQVMWCVYPYGDMSPCRLQDALAVQTRSKLIIASYSDKRYSPVFQPLASEVMCAHAQASVDTAPNLLLFTKDHVLQIWPIAPDAKPDLLKKKLILNVMAQGKKTFVGAQGNFVEDTGRYDYGGGVIANTAIPYATRTRVLQLVNPCDREE